MRRIIIVFSIILVTSMYVADDLFAYESALGLELSQYDPKDELGDRYPSDYGFGIFYEYMATEHFGMLTSIRYQNLQREGRSNEDFSILQVNLNGQIAYPFLKKWRAFITGGMGLYLWKAEKSWWTGGVAEESIDVGFNYGFGVGYRIYENIDIFAKMTEQQVKFEGASSTSNWVNLTLGARFLF